ncbi:HNH endonuclease [Nocardia cyriacigeorgica]|nr:HNH endonuclease [Nocardia cyriacigeorgica]
MLKRDGHQCVQCGFQGTPGAKQVQADHIKPLYLGGQTVIENGQTLCVPCHRAKSAQESADALRARAARGRIEPEKHPGLV